MQLIAALALLGAVVSAAPTSTIEKRTSQCGQWDSQTTGAYTLYQDLWNEAEGSGSQCSEINSLSSHTLAWDTTWSWSENSNQVKSFANVVTKVKQVEISKVSTLPTFWKYSYTGTNIVADVAYDIFTSNTAGGSDAFEIMIWLAALGGAGPISSTGKSIATVTIGSYSWNLWYGYNGVNYVYSFVAASEITSFSGDLKAFFTYLINYQGFSSSQYLVSIGAGTEPFTGSNAKLTTTAFALIPTYSS